MTISSEVRKTEPFIGNDVTTALPFAFKVFTADEVLVVRANSAGVETTLVLNTDYTVSLNPDQNANPGGTVNLTSPLATGFTAVVSSELENIQPTDLTNQGGFYPQVITNALDRATILIQQLAEKLSRAIKTTITDTRTPEQLLQDIFDTETNAAASAQAAANSESAALQSEQNAAASEQATADAVAQAVDGEKDLFVGGVDYTIGVTTSLVLSSAPAKSGTVKVFWDGVYQNSTEWALVGSTITFTGPITASEVEVAYNIPSQFVGLSEADLTVLGNAQAGAQAAQIAAETAETNAETAQTNAVAARIAAEAARDAAQLSAGVYANTAAGLAATVSGEYFSVPQASPNSIFLDLYLNDAGVADFINSYPSTSAVNGFEIATLRALLARNGTASNLSNKQTATLNDSGAGGQVIFRYQNGSGVTPNGLFASLRLTDLVGASFPSSATDATVFSSSLRIETFASGVLQSSNALTLLAGTDIFYFKNSTFVTAGITEIKVFAVPAVGVTFEFDECSIHIDGGYSFPEIANRNRAITEAVSAINEDVIAGLNRFGQGQNLLAPTTSGEATGGTIQLIKPIEKTLTTYSAIVELDVPIGVYPTDGSAIAFRAETFRGAGGSTLSAFRTLTRIPNTKLWYALDVPAGTGPHTAVKITVAAPAGEKYRITRAVIVEGGIPRLAPSVRPQSAYEALSFAAFRRVDFVMIGDSNQAFNGYGFSGGFLKTLAAKFGEYATGIGSGAGANIGEREYVFGLQSGAPAGIEAIWPASSPQPYKYIADGDVQSPGFSGNRIIDTNDLGVANALRVHYGYGTFNFGAGSFRPAARLNVSPFTTVATAPLTNTNTGAFSRQILQLDIPANPARTQGIEAKIYNPATGVSITGPFVSFFTRFENTARDSGVSCHTLYGAGGQSLYDMAAQLNAYSNLALTNFFTEVRRLQLAKSQNPIVVVYINSGLNDRNETSSPSLGWRASTDPDSPTAYIDNLEAIMKRIEGVWTASGWNLSELFFLVVPSHPVSSPDDTELVSYRAAAYTAAGRQRASFADFTDYTSYTSMLASGFYASGGADTSHLTDAGYDALAQIVVNRI